MRVKVTSISGTGIMLCLLLTKFHMPSLGLDTHSSHSFILLESLESYSLFTGYFWIFNSSLIIRVFNFVAVTIGKVAFMRPDATDK